MGKRKLQEGGSGSSARGSKRRPNVSHCRNASGGVSLGEFASFVEPLFRKVVGEEVERVMSRFHDPSLRAPSNPVGTSEERSFRLQFVTKLPATIFTGSQIEAEDGTPLRIELVDGRTHERVTSGPLSSIKLEIVVLDGDFGLDEGEDWTEKEFNCNIVREREGKRPLITGELTAMLQGGIGCLGDLIITDNSSWMRSRKFRLGARAVRKVSAEIRVREARSDTFVVKEHRGEVNKKHYPPSLSDEVWRLEKIAKDGTLHKRMRSRSIDTVQDFLQLHKVDASSLRNILGIGITNRTWETIVRHASTCVVDDDKMYTYYQDSNQAGILFNSVMEVTQATLDGQTYQSLDQLTHSQKILVQSLRRQAYYSKNQWVPLDSLPSIVPSRVLTNLPTESLIGLSPPHHHPCYTVPNQAEIEPCLDSDRPRVTPECNDPLASTSHCCNVAESRQLDCLGTESHIIAKILDPTTANGSTRQDVLSSFSTGWGDFEVPSPIPGNLTWTLGRNFC